MKKDNEFNNVLNECLERLLTKGETIEQCLLSYPEYAAELEPLLHTVVATKKALAIQPRPEFKAEARYQFGLALQKIEPKRRLPFLGWQPRWAIAMVVVLVLLLAGGGTVVAAGDSMPDGLLYPVKLATEQVRLKLTPSNMGKAELYAELADRRVAEIVYMVNKGKPEHLESTAERLNKHLVLIASLSLAESGESAVMLAPAAEESGEGESRESAEMLAPAAEEADEVESGESAVMLAPAAEEAAEVESGEKDSTRAKGRDKLRSLLGRNAANHSAVLADVLKTAPESAKPALRRVIERLEAGYEKALEALD